MQHHQDGAGYPYGSPPTGMVSLSPQPGPATMSVPYPSPMLPPPTGANFDELAVAVTGGGGGNFRHDEDMGMPVDAGSGAGGSGSRWPREETLALIRIRSEMDGAFRNAALKAPLWEEVSRKLAELGYRRGAKKCKEKFENVDKYYKRTKEGRAGRQDGKTYRFFSELEALHAAAPPQQHNQTAIATTTTQPLAVAPQVAPAVPANPGAGLLPDLGFSSSSESESDDESDEEEDQAGDIGGRNKTVMALFEGVIKRITEKQDESQRMFLDTLDKWEADRTAREEAWRRQELARISSEREQHARERAASAARDAALIAFLKRVGGTSVLPSPMPPVHAPPAHVGSLQLVVAPPPKADVGGRAGGGEGSGGMSRWPKEEVEALIQLRMEKDEHYQGVGTAGASKGPLWEDISAGMRRIGYNRSSKRCKEKWENINKYFKKVKESNKRRPEDSKTCPYFHQLDAIYRKKQFAGSGGGRGGSSPATGNTMATTTAHQQWRELEGKMSNDSDKRYIVGGESLHAPPGTGEPPKATNKVLDAIATNKKAEDSMTMATEANMQTRQKELATPDETDSDDTQGNYTDEGDDDGNEDEKMKYMVEFQKSKEAGSSSTPPAPATVSAPTSSSTFLAVQ
ncbi:trihelix transcription factor GT-2-like [Lolium rigidum]|uniref:trihelix transcription factor GT-2-like n=1 Tax=Lolium rigidum TaxID=89674 RepID=UPI001F5CB4A6|nr:trihelix transcription factor GT-2-like [Lolium rigidum]